MQDGRGRYGGSDKMSHVRVVANAAVALVLAASCIGWVADSVRLNRRSALLENAEAPTVVPAQNVMVLPAGSVQSGLQQVLGTVTGIRVTGELRPVGALQAARVTELAPGRANEAVAATGQLEAVSPQETATTAGIAAAAVPTTGQLRMGGAVAAAVQQAGAAAAQASEAVRSDLQSGGSAPELAGAAEVGAAVRPSAAHLAFNGGVFWQAAQAAAQDKSQITRLAAREIKLGSEESQLSTGEKGLRAAVSSDGKKDTALTSVVKHNRLAINDLTEKLHRQKLIDEGQYGILYRRLTAVADRLRSVETDEKDSKKAILRAQATLHIGNQMLATAGRPWQQQLPVQGLQPVQGPPAPQPYYAPPVQYTGPQVQYSQYQQPAYQQLAYQQPQQQQQQQVQQPAHLPPPPSPSPSLSHSQLKADVECAKAGVFCTKPAPAGSRQDEGDWGRLGTASEHGAREASEAGRQPHHSTGRKATIHKAFEDMDPEQLMSGYHLAGGAHPGEHLAKARRSWFQQHLAELHRQSGSVIGHGGDGGLREKRAQITKKLLKLASVPDHRRVSHGGEPERLGVAERTFAAEAKRAAQERDAAGSALAGVKHHHVGRNRGSEEERLNALEEKRILSHGAPDDFSKEEDSLRDAIRERTDRGVGEGEGGREDARRAEDGGRGAAREGEGREDERRGESEHRDVAPEHRQREEEEEAARVTAREHLARKLWSDSIQSRAAAGFERASKARRASPYKAAMTGSVFEHFLRHPNPRQLSGQALAGGVLVGGGGEASTHSSEAAMVARAGVRTHNVEGHDIPSGYTGFVGF